MYTYPIFGVWVLLTVICELWGLDFGVCHGFPCWGHILQDFALQGRTKQQRNQPQVIFYMANFCLLDCLLLSISWTCHNVVAPIWQCKYSLLRRRLCCHVDVSVQGSGKPTSQVSAGELLGLNPGAGQMFPPWQLDMVLLRKPAALTKLALRTNQTASPVKKI